MKKLMMTSALLFVVFASINVDAKNVETKPVQTVEFVDLHKYMGDWHEIASIPQFFQRKCVANTVARYEILPDQSVQVLNSCDTKDGERISSEGRAKVSDPQTNAKLDVTFARIFGRYVYTIGGKYWIISLDKDYRYAIVGHPKRKYGWILARSGTISTTVLSDLVKELRAQEYDPCEFNITPQDGGFKTATRLCDAVK